MVDELIILKLCPISIAARDMLEDCLLPRAPVASLQELELWSARSTRLALQRKLG